MIIIHFKANMIVLPKQIQFLSFFGTVKINH